MTFTIGKRIILGFSACLAVTAALGFFAYWRVGQMQKTVAELTDDSLQGAVMSGQITALVERSSSQTLQHVAADNDEHLRKIEAELRDTDAKLDEVIAQYGHQATEGEDRRLFDHMVDARKDWQSAKAAVLMLSAAHKDKEATAAFFDQGHPAFVKFRDASTALTNFNLHDANDDAVTIQADGRSARTGTIVGLLLALAIGATLSALITTSLNRVLSRLAAALGDGSQQVAAAASQVSGSSQQLAQGASEQAAALEETTSALAEIDSMTRKNAATAQQTAALAAEARSATDAGTGAVARMDAAVNDIQRSATETTKILKTIDEIAFQTNLLALNAAVEAARAGEAGKGFAVVAEEVRNLALRSAEAARNTASLIEGSVTAARNGATIGGEVAKALGAIGSSVTQVNGLVAEMSGATQEQSQSITQINAAMGQMDQVTQGAAASAEEGAAAAEELSSQAEQLRSAVRELTRLIGVTETSVATTPRRSSSPVPANRTSKPSPTRRQAPGGFDEFSADQRLAA